MRASVVAGPDVFPAHSCHAPERMLDAPRAKWVIGAMIIARSETLPGWRAGLLVLGLYAMLLQVFLAGLAGPAHSLAGPDGAVLCVSGEASVPGQAPVTPHAGHECVCAALCHAGGALPGARASFAVVPSFEGVAGVLHAALVVSRADARVHPPARAPPRNDVVL
ncbi:MAG: hypothetical protein Q8M31_03475 [Beijerinckiaceae bacterium]|nr:hypothetical protein [Beijerinckiaceae bacterium]